MPMKNLHDQLVRKFKKLRKQPSISMRLRLFFFLSVLVFTMVAGIIIILLVTGTFSAGISESKQLVRNELFRTSKEISKRYGQLSIEAVEYSKELSLKIEDALNNQNLSFSELSDHPDQIEEIVFDLYESTFYELQKSNCSGAFFILDTTVNTSLANSNNSKVGLYIKNMEPNIVSATSGTFTILRGFSSIGRVNKMNLHAQWKMEFDVAKADYYNLPIATALKNKELSVSKLYYWSEPFILPDTSEEVMVCSVPLIDSKNNVYGVCGFEVSSMLFKLSYMPSSSTYSRMFCMLSPLQESSIAINRSVFAGGYSVKDLSREFSELVMKESKSFTSYTSNDDSVYLGLHIDTQLYPSDSPYTDTNWITAILVPREDVVDSITRLNIILICLLIILVTTGIIISIIFSNRYLRPISKGFEIIKSANTEVSPKTNIQEIDDLINYLILYQKELTKKAEQDKYQITLLEQFINKTKTLSPAEHSVFILYAKGLSAKEIADEMFLSINTIKTHSKHIFVKLQIASREELLLYVNMLKEIGLEIK